MWEESLQYLKSEINGKMKLTDLIHRKISGNFYKKMINNFFKEVVGEIGFLKEANYLGHKEPLDCFYNDDDDVDYEPDPAVIEMIRRKYSEKYCPTFLFRYFNKSERFNYLILRNKIDKLLNIKGTIYQL